MNTPPTGSRRRKTARALFALLGVPLLSMPLLVAGTSAAPARAASLDGMMSFDGFHVGAFRSSDGALVYCLEPGMNTPASEQLQPHVVTALPAYTQFVSDGWGWSGWVTTEEATGETMRRMNWVLAEHGGTTDPSHAVSVQVALWELRRGPGNAGWIDAKLALIAAGGGQGLIDAGMELARSAAQQARGPGFAVPDGRLEVSAGETHGSGTVSYPVGTKRLDIDGGRFADGSTEAILDGATAGSLDWTADLHADGWARLHEVRVTGSWELAERYWPAELVLHPPSQENEQRLGTGVGATAGSNRGDFDAVALTIDSRFAPMITTAVPQGVVPRADGVFSDTVTVTAGEPGAPWPRLQNGESLPLTAQGTLYGPFNAPQPEAEEAPAGAPVSARASLEIDRGPGDYGVETRVSEPESGYYYWVWEIVESAQTDAVVRSELLESGGVYRDRFGVHAERQAVPSQLRWITALEHRTLDPERRVLEDRIRVSLHRGAWLRDENGERIPARIRFTVYRTDERPVRQAEPSAEAVEIGTVFADVRETDVWVDAPPFEVPAEVRGWVTIRACLLEEDQEEDVRGRIEEWCDDFGVPEETAEILVPAPPAPPVSTPRTETPAVAKGLADTAAADGTGALLSGAGALTMVGALLASIIRLRRKVAKGRRGIA